MGLPPRAVFEDQSGKKFEGSRGRGLELGALKLRESELFSFDLVWMLNDTVGIVACIVLDLFLI